MITCDGNNAITESNLDPQLLNEPGLRTMIGLRERALRLPRITFNSDYFLLYTHDGTWCELRISAGRMTVAQGGPRHVWAAIEQAWREWERFGRPGPERYGVTVTSDGLHKFWIDHPEQAVYTDPFPT